MSKSVKPAVPAAEPCGAANRDRPAAAEGSVDWEQFFEHHQEGLIPLILEAETFDKLRKCTEVVVDSLFARNDDAEKREAFGRIVHNFLESQAPQNTAEAPLEAKEGLAKILRYIKDDRKARADAFVKAEAERPPEERAQPFRKERRQPSGLVDLEPPPEAPRPAEEPEPPAEEPAAADHAAPHIDPHALFVEVFWEVIEDRLRVLQSGVRTSRRAGHTLPFMFTEDFATHFGEILRDNILPLVADRSRGLVHQTELQPLDKRHDFLRHAMNDDKNRRVLWETWKGVWKESTAQQPLPPKPKETKKGLASKLLKRKDDAPAWKKKEMTLEEWEAECRHIKRANRRAEQLWQTIAQPSKAYQAPEPDHNDFLMELFGRSPKVMREQIAALRQIATQGGNEGKAYDMYQKGKNLDLALLAACYWYPKEFLEGSRPMLKVFTAAYPKGSLPGFMPLLAHYLADQLD